MTENNKINLFCVISKATYGDHKMHDIQANSSWHKNPYGEEYAIVPNEMVEAIMETRGYCDIVLNEEETEVVSFIAREIPVIEEPTEQLETITEADRLEALEMAVAELANEVYNNG